MNRLWEIVVWEFHRIVWILSDTKRKPLFFCHEYESFMFSRTQIYSNIVFTPFYRHMLKATILFFNVMKHGPHFKHLHFALIG